MDTELTPTQLAIEFLRRDPAALTPAQYLKKLKLLELEFADLMALSSMELKEEIDHALALRYPLTFSLPTKLLKSGPNGPLFLLM